MGTTGSSPSKGRSPQEATSTPEVARLDSLSREQLHDLAERMRDLGTTAWASLPELALTIESPFDRPHHRLHGPLRGVVSLRRRLSRRAGPRLIRVGPVLFVHTGGQIDRVLGPIEAHLAHEFGDEARLELPRLSVSEGWGARRCVEPVLDSYRGWLGDQGLTEPKSLVDELTKIEVIRRRAQRSDLTGVSVVVVGTQHNASARALLAAARASAVRTAYVPHAPAADNAYYDDLPVDAALLRGPAEVDRYAILGADRAGMAVAGDPAQGPPVRAPRADHVMFAPSTQSRAVLAADVEVLARATDRPVVVSVHPRMSAADLADVAPSSWTILPPRPTSQNLTEVGAFALVQHGSGVGLEGLLRGVDVIDLRATGERPTYAYLQEPHIQSAHDSLSAAAALGAIESRRRDEGVRTAFARTWSSRHGAAAAAAAARQLVEMTRNGRGGTMLLDAWSPR